jgi:RNA methyltransferase, TrmH family
VHLAGSNPKVQRLRRLIGRRSVRYQEGLFVVEGATLVRDALGSSIEILEVFLREDRIDSDESFGNTDVYVLDAELFNSLSDTVTPQGVMAVCRIPEQREMSWTADSWILIADGVSDPGNLGTIIRSGEIAGVSAIVLLNNSVDPYGPKTVRASAGSLFHIPVISHLDYEDLRSAGFRLVGTTSHDNQAAHPRSLYELNCVGKIGIVLGNEAHGISINSPMNEWVTIEHVGRSESLNVAMAASIIAMYVSRQRQIA